MLASRAVTVGDNRNPARSQPPQTKPPILARAGTRIADACERYFPDAFVFALAAVLLVFVDQYTRECRAKSVSAFE